MAVAFRPGGEGDAPFLAGLAHTLFAEFGNYEQSLRDWLHGERVVTRILLRDEEPVGFLMVETYPEREGAYLLALGIVSRWQGQGLGKQLVQEAVEVARGARPMVPVRELWLSVADTNQRAQHLFCGQGFRLHGPDSLLYERGQQALLMVRQLR